MKEKESVFTFSRRARTFPRDASFAGLFLFHLSLSLLSLSLSEPPAWPLMFFIKLTLAAQEWARSSPPLRCLHNIVYNSTGAEFHFIPASRWWCAPTRKLSQSAPLLFRFPRTPFCRDRWAIITHPLFFLHFSCPDTRWTRAYLTTVSPCLTTGHARICVCMLAASFFIERKQIEQRFISILW